MTKLDIRYLDEDAIIDEIVFASNEDQASSLRLIEGEARLSLRDSENCDSEYVNLCDIDNLILALKKAKELWTDKG